ncbi:MAG: glycosyltransferase family 2 protein [Kaistella sp.]|nr:glycosyltransferase family 2 protein [Kaistella sp.]
MLTIIIPYYKITFLKETLSSLERQTCKNFNLFIGNDASPDDPEHLIRKVLKTTPFIYKKYNENLGAKNLVKHWQRCIEDSNIKEWFMILGDDDVISGNFVKAFYSNLNEINKYHCNVIKFSQGWIDEKGTQIREFTNYPKLMKPFENWEKKFINGDQSSLSEHIFRTSSYLKHGFRHFPLAWSSDDFAVLEISDGKDIYFIKNAEVKVRISKENISGKTDNEEEKKKALHLANEYLINKYYREIPKDYLSSKIQEQIKYAFQHQSSDLKINLIKLYWYLKDYKKLLNLPKTYFYLYTK